MENVRLSIDIQGLKQLLWERADGTILDELEPESVAENAVRWIDTSCMIVDCLTKRMKPDLTLRLMEQGKLCLKPTAESQLLKLRKQKLRAEKKAKAESGPAGTFSRPLLMATGAKQKGCGRKNL